jgi:uncharacterized membrane protein
LRSIYYRRNPGAGYLEGTIRMCSITDNMTAVAITFLIATITGTLQSTIHQPFSTALNAVLAELPVYGFSLLIVGFYWLSHHRIYMVIRRHNMTLIWLNFAFLLCIELQPIFNGLRASYPTSQLTAILYASNQVVTGLMLLMIWLYAATGAFGVDRKRKLGLRPMCDFFKPRSVFHAICTIDMSAFLISSQKGKITPTHYSV